MAELLLSIKIESILHSAQLSFDEWRNDQTKALEISRDSYQQHIDSLLQQIADMKEKINKIKAVEEQIKEEEMKENLKVKEFSDKIEQLKGKENVLSPQLLELQSVFEVELEKLTRRMRELDLKEKQGQEIIESFNQEILLYEKYLGLRVSKDVGKLRFQFSLVSKEDPERVYEFSMGLNKDRRYELFQCDPSIGDCQQELNQLNQSNNLAVFVQAIRKRFKRLAEETEARSV